MDQNKDSNIEAYRVLIEQIADQSDPNAFYNSAKEHASIVMANIFKKSKISLRILARDLNGAVSNDYDYQVNLTKFLHKENGHLYVLLEKIPKDSQIFKLIRL